MSRLKLYASCIPVKGANRSIICDLQRNEIHLIPNDLFEILSLENKTTEEINLFFNHKHNTIIDEYFNYLIVNELAFFTDTPELFPKLNLQWYYPFEVSNAIIDIDETSKYSIKTVIDQLDKLNCKYLQIRFFLTIPKKTIKELVEYINNIESIISSIDFIISSNTKFSEEELTRLLNYYPRINSFSIYNSKMNKIVTTDKDKSGYIIYSRESITKLSCGIISPQYFTINTKNFTEGQLYNSCLNKKISIDSNGNIKNCPSMSESFGNIMDTTLYKVIENKAFKKYWSLTKDQIDTCKDCEFRYVCTDCRAYVENPKDILSKPLKCGYNPFTNEWQDWSKNPLKKKAIKYYGMESSTSKE